MALSAMMQQYLNLKQQHKDEILLFRVGDFYEMFFDDALTASRELELTLTGKDCGLEERAPMCGVPWHAVDTYIAKLVQKGYRAAICEQLTDPALSKGLVERDVTRIVTAGTATEPGLLNEKDSNYILSIFQAKRLSGFAFCDVSTGEFFVYSLENTKLNLTDEFNRITPSEVVSLRDDAIKNLCAQMNITFSPREEGEFHEGTAKRLLSVQFMGDKPLIEQLSKPAIQAAGALISYLNETQKISLSHIDKLQIYDYRSYMLLDRAASVNLEIVSSIHERSRKGSLLGTVDRTLTSMGARQLKGWLEKPLLNEDEINARLDAVETFYNEPMLLDELRAAFGNVYDIERLLSKIAFGSVNPRDCLSLSQSLEAVPAIRQLLLNKPGIIGEMAARLDSIDELKALLDSAISPEAPMQIREGGIFKRGFNEQLDKYHDASANGKTWLNQLEQQEREQTGIKNLKIGYNRLFGYYIEVTKSFYDLVPLRYARKQTLANCERFITDELKQLENTILGAEDNSVKLEYELFLAIREELKNNIDRIRTTAEALKTLDCLQSMGKCALDNGYTRPKLNTEGRYEIKNGRHPTVERSIGQERFVPNDTSLSDSARIMIITGPNMAGKSTYMRQVALIVLLAQTGSFVPASQADISITDRIFTRIGASDDLYGGRSTFMVEMEEMSVILKNATEKSLVILDEVGRGTSTFDGLSIAWAAIEHLAGKKVGARALFATHYHELSVLEGKLEGVVNYRVTALERGEEVVMLRKVVPGGEDKSYGIAVAKLAGVPAPVVNRARQIMARLEVDEQQKGSLGETIINQKRPGDRQLSLNDLEPMQIVDDLLALDLMSMSPIEALNELFTLKEKASRI
ncbi:MAG: DNA mismatch repair protein MutS [Clostridia bacterium]|nr:DNA mismatch repair protein MutS [Clostridia bacterium]